MEKSKHVHLLSKHGILTEFNIIKRFSKPISKSKKELKIDQKDIPGMIVPQVTIIPPRIAKNIVGVTNTILGLCNKFKFSKDHVIFVVQAVLHTLKISNDDMELFKKKYKINSEEE